MNGYPTNFWHGDWFASKGIGVCQIRLSSTSEDEDHDIDYFDIHLYVSHYHANYDPTNDIYLGHRVIHAFESAQWIKLASSSADLYTAIDERWAATIVIQNGWKGLKGDVDAPEPSFMWVKDNKMWHAWNSKKGLGKEEAKQ